MMNTKHKHLTLSDRNDIQMGIEQKKTFRAIAQLIGKDPSTVSKEVRKHLTIKVSSQTQKCETCPLLKRAPYACNGCPKKRIKCGFTKQFYYAKRAQLEYERDLSESREGVALNKPEFYEMDNTISEAVAKGQHINHIVVSNTLPASRTSIYRYIEKGYLTVSPIDLPRAVKFKKRRTRKLPPIPKQVKEGRTYQDFQATLLETETSSWLEMDTVIGRPGGKVLLTFNVSFCNFLFARLMDTKTALETATHIQAIKKNFYENGFHFFDYFPLILTDNGGEFARVDDIEIDFEGQSQLFFCEPNRSDQKGRIEKNHTLLRDILPKGTSFDNLSQEDINLVLSHVNSVKRHALNGKSAYDLFTFTYGEKVATILGISEIPATDVVQSPKLLKDKM